MPNGRGPALHGRSRRRLRGVCLAVQAKHRNSEKAMFAHTTNTIASTQIRRTTENDRFGKQRQRYGNKY